MLDRFIVRHPRTSAFLVVALPLPVAYAATGSAFWPFFAITWWFWLIVLVAVWWALSVVFSGVKR
jgi:hypothetical protein